MLKLVAVIALLFVASNETVLRREQRRDHSDNVETERIFEEDANPHEKGALKSNGDMSLAGVIDERDIPQSKEIFGSLCHTVEKEIVLSDTIFEFQPTRYKEVWCSKKTEIGEKFLTNNNQMCEMTASACMQRWRSMQFVRRQRGTECWEPVSYEVPFGCECVYLKR